MFTGPRVRRTLRDPRVHDAALAAAVAALAGLEVAVSDELGQRPVAAVAALLVTLPVAVRRRFPLGALATAAATFVAQALAGASLSQSIAAGLAVLILVFSVATQRSGRQAALGLGIAICAFWLTILAETERGTVEHAIDDYPFVAFWAIAVCLAGYALRGRARRISGLEGETIRLGREREERARVAVAAERARIARDLHDIVAHSVSVIVVQAAAAEEVLGREPERARAPLRAIQETGDQALTEMRRLLGILRATDDARERGRQPGLAGLNALATEFREAGLPVEVAVEGDSKPLPAGVDLAAYRIVEEALTNALKHSARADTRVRVRHLDDAIDLEVTDDGPEPATVETGGHGLIGMRERARLYGGTLDAGPRTGSGFAVRARLPLVSDAAGARWDP